MIRFAAATAALFLFAAPSLAEAAKPSPELRAEQALKSLPSEAELAELEKSMPDFNLLMRRMQAVLDDPKTKSSMKALGEKMEQSFDKETMAKTADGKPDLNAMMGSMMAIASDKDVMREFLTLGFTLAGEMEAATADALPPDARKPKTERQPAQKPRD
jgi:hypothetical protein